MALPPEPPTGTRRVPRKRPNSAWPKKAVQKKTAFVGRSFELGLAYFRLSVPDVLTAFALGLAFSPQFCPAFLLSRSNRRSARGGDAFALAGCLWTARAGLVAPFFCLRSAQYFFILTLTERRSAAVICRRPRREPSCEVTRLEVPSRRSGNARSS